MYILNPVVCIENFVPAIVVGVLTVKHVDRLDEGTYICEADNGIDRVQTKAVFVNVLGTTKSLSLLYEIGWLYILNQIFSQSCGRLLVAAEFSGLLRLRPLRGHTRSPDGVNRTQVA